MGLDIGADSASAEGLVALDAELLHDAVVLADLGAHVVRELGARAAAGLDAQSGETLAHIGSLERHDGVGVDALENVERSARRREESPPGRKVIAGIAAL